ERIRKTPATAVIADTRTDQLGLTPSEGQASKATQMGKTLVMASTLEMGISRVMAKKAHTRLTLPARLRIHSDRGRKNTSLAPATKAKNRAKIKAKPVRARPIICQSQF